MSDQLQTVAAPHSVAPVPSEKRTAFLDVLRLVGIFSVVVVHVSFTGWETTDVDTLRWQTLNAFAGTVRYATPLLLMISGYLFLDPARSATPRQMVTQRLPRLGLAFVFWSALYTLVRVWLSTEPPDPATVLDGFLNGAYHLWYLGAIAGVYLVTPLLRPIAADRQLSRYFLALAFVFASVLPLLQTLGWYPDSILTPEGLKLHFVLGYTGYYLLGHVLGRSRLSRNATRTVYALGVLGLVVTVAGTSVWSLATGIAQTDLYYRLNPTVAFTAAALFLAVKNHTPALSPRVGRVLAHLGKRGFGIYLVHALVLTLVRRMLPVEDIPAIVLVPALSVLVFGLSWAASTWLARIPHARGRIV